MEKSIEPKIKVKVIVRKYNGDPPKKGENKQPVEVVEIEKEFSPEDLKGKKHGPL